MKLRFIKTGQNDKDNVWNGERINGVKHPKSIIGWPDDELAAIGLERFEPEKAEPTGPPPRRTGEFNELMALFTDPEQQAIAGAAMENVVVKIWYDQALAANSIDLDSPNLVAGMQALVREKLISQKRVDQILAGNFSS